MTLHDVVFGLVGILLAYIAWMLLRFIRHARHSNVSDTSAFSESQNETIHSQILGGDPGMSFSSAFYDGASTLPAEPEIRPEPRISRPLEPDASTFGFDALLEVRQTRTLLDDLSNQHAELQAEVAGLREALTELRAASQISPLYSEAVSLARRGYDVQAIAERCGISVAEAELVRSLSGDSSEKGAGNA